MLSQRHTSTNSSDTSQSHGYLAGNTNAKSERSPTHRGRIYVAEPGWHWLAGWQKNRNVISIVAEPMTDEEVERYCQPNASKTEPTTKPPDTTRVDFDDDIPF